jgi:hypothetical protein
VIEQPSERAAAAIVRAWIETGETDGLRVRVTEVLDLDRGTSRAHPAVTSADEACEIICRWLDGFVAGSAAGGADRTAEDEPPPR